MAEEFREYEDDDRIKEELISSSKFEHFKSKPFKEIELERTESLGIDAPISTISSSMEFVLKTEEKARGQTAEETSQEYELAIQYLTSKVFDNRRALAQLYISASFNTDPVMTGSLSIKTPGHITASGNISSSGKIIANELDLESSNVKYDPHNNILRLADNIKLGIGAGPSSTTGDLTIQSDGANVGLSATVGNVTLTTTAGDTIIKNNHAGGNILLQSDKAGSGQAGGVVLISGSNPHVSLDVRGNITASNIDAVDGDFDGTLEADAITINGTNVNSLFVPINGSETTIETTFEAANGTVGTATNAQGLTGTPSISITNITSSGNSKLGNAASDTHTITGNITASGNISSSGTITADDGSGKQFTVRPNLYFFATNTSATIQTNHGDGTGEQEGSLPSTNTTTITLSQQQNSHSSVFSLSSNRLTIARAGLYKFTYNAVIEINNGSGRAEGFCGLVQESGGSVTLVNGSETRGYHRFKHDQGPSGVTFAASVIVNVAANSIYDLRFGQEDQSVADSNLRTLPSGTSIIVEAIT